MKNLKRNVNGITLIALVITIIILLILAGVTISTALGQNGLFQRAKVAGESYKKSETDETEKLDEYTNEMDKITSTNSQTSPTGEKLAKDVLTIDPNAEEDYKKSPYVKYNGILCRVFYNDEYNDGKHGLQIISADNKDEITLGSDNDFEKAKNDYNNAVDTLNEEARNYMSDTDKMAGTDENKVAIDARSLGSIATLKDGKFQLEDTTSMYPSEGDTIYEYLTRNNLNGELKKADINYEEDAKDKTDGQVQKLCLNATSTTWLASRKITDENNEGSFGVRVCSPNGDSSSISILFIYDMKKTADGEFSFGFRPVFLLSSNVKIKSGDGKKDSPYELEI